MGVNSAGTHGRFHRFPRMSAANEHRQPVVLVVEDEVWVLLDVAEALEEHGFLVLCARNGDEALDVLEDRDDIGFVFSDINMPGSLDGLELAREVRSRRPEVGLLLTSGRYCEEDAANAGCSIFIPKPYEPKIVISRINGLIGVESEEGAATGQCFDRQ